MLLGVGFEKCTALHLAEYRLPWPPPTKPYRCFVMEDGSRVAKDFIAADLDESLFGRMGQDIDRQPFVRQGRVGGARARIADIRDLVDFAIGWYIARAAA